MANKPKRKIYMKEDKPLVDALNDDNILNDKKNYDIVILVRTHEDLVFMGKKLNCDERELSIALREHNDGLLN